MDKKITKIRDDILLAALPEVPFDGWTWEVMERAAVKAGHSKDMASAAFPDKLKGVLTHFSDYADRRMLESLKDTDPQELRIRDRIALAVRQRLEALSEYKEAEKGALAFWVRPFRKWEGVRLCWRTADRIWDWAGDTATDYNRYTKRGLLSGVLASTTLFWVNDRSAGHGATWEFLDRRIENVMQLGKIVGKMKRA